MIWLVIVVLSGLLAIGVAIDLARAWLIQRDERSHEARSHAALMRELRRQP